jgi:hypothetical protein
MLALIYILVCPVLANVYKYEIGAADPGNCPTVGFTFDKKKNNLDEVIVGGVTTSKSKLLSTSVADCLDHYVPFVSKN